MRIPVTSLLTLTTLFLLIGCSPKEDPAPSQPEPKAAFVWGTTGPGRVQFTNQSTNADSYSWDFGDGTALESTKSPSHTYARNGNYVVKLKATNARGSNSVNGNVQIATAPLTIDDAFDDKSLLSYLPGVWAVYLPGTDYKFDNYSYQFSATSPAMVYKNYYNSYFTLIDPQTTTINYDISVLNKVIYTKSISGKYEKYARFEIVSPDEMRFFRIIETSSTYSELQPYILTKTSNVERTSESVIASQSLLPILKGVWDQGKYSIYDDVFFDFSAGKNFYNYNSTFQGAKSIQKTEIKIDANNIMSYRNWNSDFNPAWKKYKVEVISNTSIKLYPVDVNGTVSRTADYTLNKRQ